MISVVMGAQFGSEGKGAICQHIDRTEHVGFAVRTGGPNAGHSVVLNGRKIALRHIPAFIEGSAKLLLAQHSLIDLAVLEDEISMLDECGYNVRSRLFIDPMASIIRDVDKEAEHGMHEKIGSTAKGIGAAEAAKIMRTGMLARECAALAPYMADTKLVLRTAVRSGQSVVIETTQGIGLGLHAGFYPYCTSRDISPTHALADCGLPPIKTRNILVARTFPIRVAGTSGPLANETTWDELHACSGGKIEAERTTVTKKIRRVGWWDDNLFELAVGICSAPTSTFVTFGDYLGALGRNDVLEEILRCISRNGSVLAGISYGPTDVRVAGSMPCPYSS